jgi:hypothetical protein
MRQPIAFFVSYAHADNPQATTFAQRLHEQLRPSKHYDYSLWRDTDILVGERWHETILQALNACQMGLCLVSPNFLASSYITQHELPHFVSSSATSVIPVMLKSVDWQRHDLKGLEAHQIFQMEPYKAFADCPNDRTRRRFVELLFAQIERRLDRLFPHHPTA